MPLRFRVSIEMVQQDVAIGIRSLVVTLHPGFLLSIERMIEEFEPYVAPLCLPLSIIQYSRCFLLRGPLDRIFVFLIVW